MPVSIESTTDSPEDVQAAMGGLAKGAEGADKSAAAAGDTADKTAETTDDSETSQEGKSAEADGAADDSTDDDTDSDEDEGEGDKPKPGKKKSGFKKRIDKLNAKVSEKDREVEFWKAKALEREKAAASDKPRETKTETKADTTGKPDPDKYASHEEYIEALADWKYEQKRSSEKREEQEKSVKKSHDDKVAAHQKKVLEFAKKHDDFQERWNEAIEGAPASLAVYESILDSEVGPELMDELSKDKELYVKIASMPAMQAAKEIGKIEDRIIKAQTPSGKQEKTKTKAPAPINPVGSGRSAAARDINDPDVPYQEWKKMREAQLTR
jgi:hypothetical protein